LNNCGKVIAEPKELIGISSARDSNKERPEELIRFVMKHRKDEDFRFVVYPSTELKGLEKEQVSLSEFV